MSDEEDAFQAVASQCMNVLVLGLNTRLDASLQVLGLMYGLLECAACAPCIPCTPFLICS